MNIVFYDDLPDGGAKRVVYEQVKGLIAKHHEVTYITNSNSSLFTFNQLDCAIFRFNLELDNGLRLLRPIKELSFYYKILPTLYRIANLINRIKPDVVIVHPSRIYQASPLLQLIHQPTLYFAEECLRIVYEPKLHPLPHNKLKAFYESLRRSWLAQVDLNAVRSATTVVCTSTYMKKTFKSIYHRDTELLPLGVDELLFKPKQHQTEHSYLLFVGDKEEINGYPLLEAWKASKLNTIPIKYVQFTKDKKFGLSENQMVDKYQNALATLCLAEKEPFGLVALESMACQTPVIAVNEGGYIDTIQHQKTGLLIDRSPSALNSAIELLAHHKAMRNEMGVNGRKRIITHFTWKTHIEMLEKMLWRIAG